jgi:hypothetical protein
VSGCPFCRLAAVAERSDDREFLYELRRGLLAVVATIERKYSIGRYEPQERSLEPTRPVRVRGDSSPTQR